MFRDDGFLVANGVAGDRLVSLVSPHDLGCHGAGLVLVSTRAWSTDTRYKIQDSFISQYMKT